LSQGRTTTSSEFALPRYAYLLGWTFVAVILVASVFFGRLAMGSRIVVHEEDMLPESSLVASVDERLRTSFGDDRQVAIVFRSTEGQLLEARVQDAYREFLGLLAEDPLLRVYLVDPLYRPLPRPPEEVGDPWLLEPPAPARLEARLGSASATARTSVSRSGDAAILFLPVPAPEQEEPILARLDAARDSFRARHGAGFLVRILSVERVQQALGDQIQSDLLRWVPWTIAVVGGLFLLVFRSSFLALLVLAKLGLACCWTLGFLASRGQDISLMTALIPVLLAALGVADEIHLFAEYRRQRALASGGSRTGPVLAALRSVLVPITLTTLTTALGFGSFVVTDIPALRVFGFTCAVGVLVSWALTVTLIPFVLVLFPNRGAPSPWPSLEGPSVGSALSGARGRLCAMALSIPVLAGLVFLELGDSWSGNFSPSHPVVQDMRWFDDQGPGLHRFDLMMELPGSTWDEPSALEGLRRLQRRLESVEGFGTLLSLVDVVDERAGEMHLGPAEARSEASLLGRVLDTFRPFNQEYLLRTFLTEDARACRLSAFVRGDDYQVTSRLRAEIEAAVREVFGPDAHIGIGGSAERGRVMIAGIAGSQLRTMAAFLVVSAVVLILTSGRVRASLACMLSVCWALILVLGAVGWIGLPLGVATSSFIAVGSGIGVDYAIHLAFGRVPGEDEAGRYRHLLRRVLCNVVVVGLGLSVLLLSRNPAIRALSLLLTSQMAVCAGTAMVLFAPRRRAEG
jgi:predicted RND superfamily exporter protein